MAAWWREVQRKEEEIQREKRGARREEGEEVSTAHNGKTTRHVGTQNQELVVWAALMPQRLAVSTLDTIGATPLAAPSLLCLTLLLPTTMAHIAVLAINLRVENFDGAIQPATLPPSSSPDTDTASQKFTSSSAP